MKCKRCDGNGGYLDMNRWCFCEQCDGTGQDGLSNEEWFCGLDTRLKAEAIFVFMDSVSKQISGEPITNKEEIIDKVIMRWLKEKYEE